MLVVLPLHIHILSADFYRTFGFSLARRSHRHYRTRTLVLFIGVKFRPVHRLDVIPLQTWVDVVLGATRRHANVGFLKEIQTINDEAGSHVYYILHH